MTLQIPLVLLPKNNHIWWIEIQKKNWIPLRMVSSQISTHCNSNTDLTKFRNADQPNQLTCWPCNINILPSILRALFDPRNKKKVSTMYLYNYIINLYGRRLYLLPNSCYIYDMRASFNHERVSISERITVCKEVNPTNRLKNKSFKMYILQGGRWILTECIRCSGSKMSPPQCSFDKIKLAFSFWVLVKVIDFLTISSKKSARKCQKEPNRFS